MGAIVKECFRVQDMSVGSGLGFNSRGEGFRLVCVFGIRILDLLLQYRLGGIRVFGATEPIVAITL